MCDVAERLEQRGMKRGKEVGEWVGKITMCKEFGLSDEEAAKKMNISAEKLKGVLEKYTKYKSILIVNKEKEIKTMCDVAEKLEQRGLELGIEIGELVGKIIMCKDFGLSDEETAKKLNISVKTLKETLQ